MVPVSFLYNGKEGIRPLLSPYTCVSVGSTTFLNVNDPYPIITYKLQLAFIIVFVIKCKIVL